MRAQCTRHQTCFVLSDARAGNVHVWIQTVCSGAQFLRQNHMRDVAGKSTGANETPSLAFLNERADIKKYSAADL